LGLLDPIALFWCLGGFGRHDLGKAFALSLSGLFEIASFLTEPIPRVGCIVLHDLGLEAKHQIVFLVVRW
jgi:hypothetical protein